MNSSSREAFVLDPDNPGGEYLKDCFAVASRKGIKKLLLNLNDKSLPANEGPNRSISLTLIPFFHQFQKSGHGTPVPHGADRPESCVEVGIRQLGPGHTVGKTQIDFLTVRNEGVRHTPVRIEFLNIDGRRQTRKKQDMQDSNLAIVRKERIVENRLPKLLRRPQDSGHRKSEPFFDLVLKTADKFLRSFLDRGENDVAALDICFHLLAPSPANTSTSSFIGTFLFPPTLIPLSRARYVNIPVSFHLYIFIDSEDPSKHVYMSIPIHTQRETPMSTLLNHWSPNYQANGYILTTESHLRNNT